MCKNYNWYPEVLCSSWYPNISLVQCMKLRGPTPWNLLTLLEQFFYPGTSWIYFVGLLPYAFLLLRYLFNVTYLDANQSWQQRYFENELSQTYALMGSGISVYVISEVEVNLKNRPFWIRPPPHIHDLGSAHKLKINQSFFSHKIRLILRPVQNRAKVNLRLTHVFVCVC